MGKPTPEERFNADVPPDMRDDVMAMLAEATQGEER